MDIIVFLESLLEDKLLVVLEHKTKGFLVWPLCSGTLEGPVNEVYQLAELQPSPYTHTERRWHTV